MSATLLTVARPHRYHLLDVAAKLAYHRERMRSVPLCRCRDCGAQVTRRQLMAHKRQRCPRRPIVELFAS